MTRTPSLDDAQAVLLDLLTFACADERCTAAGLLVDDVQDGGTDRHERVVSFRLVHPTGPPAGVLFHATITTDPEQD